MCAHVFKCLHKAEGAQQNEQQNSELSTKVCMHISHLLNMLNNDDRHVRELAPSSQFLDVRSRNVPLGRDSEPELPWVHIETQQETRHPLIRLWSFVGLATLEQSLFPNWSVSGVCEV